MALLVAPASRINLWDVGQTAVGPRVQGPAIAPSGAHAAVSPNGQYAVFPSGSDVVAFRIQPTGITQVSVLTLPGAVEGVAWHPSGSAVAIAHASSPFVSVYRFTSTGFQAKLADPGVLPAGDGNAVAFSPTGGTLAVAHDSSPFVSVYPFSVAGGFGAKFPDPANLPPSDCFDLAWRQPTGLYLAIAFGGMPGFLVYPFTVNVGLGDVPLTDPTTTFATDGESISWSPDGTQIALARGASGNGIATYTIDATNQLVNDGFLVGPAAQVDDVRHSQAFVAMALAGAPWLTVWRYSPLASAMQPLGDAPLAASPSRPLAWSNLVGAGVPGAGNHPIRAEIVAYAPGAEGNWRVGPTGEVPIEVGQALDLLVNRVAQTEATIAYILEYLNIPIPGSTATQPAQPQTALPPRTQRPRPPGGIFGPT